MVFLVYGGQFGDEGKGRMTAYLSEVFEFDLVIRIGGSNAGHDCSKNGKRFEMRQLPCSWTKQNAPIYLPASALVDRKVFMEEFDTIVNEDYTSWIVISPEAAVIDERDLGWRERTQSIGTMGSGIAPTRARKVLREAKIVRNDPELSPFCSDTDLNQMVKDILSDPESQILIEGTQGFGLSLNVSGHYPYTTSTDITPQQMLADAGIPWGVHEILNIMVLRTYPVRVPNPPKGTSGQLWKELTWDEVSAQCGHAVEVEYDFRPPVYPTPTPRRIGTFDKEMVKKAIWHCRPSLICLTHFDWLHPEVRETQKLGSVADSTVRVFEGWIEHPIHFVGVSPEVIIPTRSLSVRNERNLRVRE